MIWKRFEAIVFQLKNIGTLTMLSDRESKLTIYQYIEFLRIEAIANKEIYFTLNILDKAKQLWQDLEEIFALSGQRLEVPDACPGNSDNFMYSWSKEGQHLECEIFSNGDVEFFYWRDGDTWGEDTKTGKKISTKIIETISLFSS